MSTVKPSALQRILTWLAIGLAALLLVLGIALHGWSWDVHQRFWRDILDRAHGPMTFRFFLQPIMALLAALPDGIRDAREGHVSFFWTAWWRRSAQTGRLRQGLTSIARVILLGISMDLIYQYRVSDQFYPAEALMMAILFAVVPYFLFRWIVEFFARRLGHGTAVP